MSTNPTPEPAAQDGVDSRQRSNLGWQIGLGFMALVLFCMFIIPGFLCGMYIKITSDPATHSGLPHIPTALRFFFAPATYIGEKFPDINAFYQWQAELVWKIK